MSHKMSFEKRLSIFISEREKSLGSSLELCVRLRMRVSEVALRGGLVRDRVAPAQMK